MAEERRAPLRTEQDHEPADVDERPVELDDPVDGELPIDESGDDRYKGPADDR
jgi:hypothetical protein